MVILVMDGIVYTLCPEIDSCKKDGVELLPYDGSRVWVGDRYLFGRVWCSEK